MPSMKKQVTSAPPPNTASRPGNPDSVAVNLPAAGVRTNRQAGHTSPDLRLPHERDQSAVDTTSDVIDPVIAQAARDLAAGQVDTDLRNQPGLDAVRRRELLKREQ